MPRQTESSGRAGGDTAAPREGPKTEEEAVERINNPPAPDPSQAEANEIKEEALGVDEGEGETDPPPTEAPSVVDVPHLMGNGTVGETLTCTMGNWNGVPSGYAYQWQRDGADFAVTGDSYVLTAEDDGHSITCIVTATNAIGSTTAPPSNAVAVTAAAAGATARREAKPDAAPGMGYRTR